MRSLRGTQTWQVQRRCGERECDAPTLRVHGGRVRRLLESNLRSMERVRVHALMNSRAMPGNGHAPPRTGARNAD